MVPAKKKAGKSFFVHSSAVVDKGALIGNNTRIWHFCHISSTSKLGENCILGQNVFVDNHVTIGNGVKIQNNVSVYKGVTLENDVFCGPSMVFTNVINPRSAIERKNEFKNTRVKQSATLGANSTIVCGVTVGAFSLIGAGAVVTRNVPDYALVMGVPARQKGWVCACGVNLSFRKGRAKCGACGKKFSLSKNRAVITVKDASV